MNIPYYHLLCSNFFVVQSRRDDRLTTHETRNPALNEPVGGPPSEAVISPGPHNGEW